MDDGKFKDNQNEFINKGLKEIVYYNYDKNYSHFTNVSMCELLAHNIICCCTPDKREIMIEKAFKLIEEKLEIKSLIQTQLDVQYLKTLLLDNKEKDIIKQSNYIDENQSELELYLNYLIRNEI